MSGFNDDHNDDIDGELFASLVGALPRETASPALKDRLMRSAASAGRFEDFLDRVAGLTDLAREQARALLTALDDTARWVGGGSEMGIFHVDAGPKLANAIVGFVRLPAGASFPEHEHVGAEVMLVIQGGMLMNGVTHRAGAEVRSPAGSSHFLVAAPGPDLVYLGIIEGGMKIDGNLITPSNPNF